MPNEWANKQDEPGPIFFFIIIFFFSSSSSSSSSSLGDKPPVV
jgi:hypothetical protein